MNRNRTYATEHLKVLAQRGILPRLQQSPPLLRKSSVIEFLLASNLTGDKTK